MRAPTARPGPGPAGHRPRSAPSAVSRPTSGTSSPRPPLHRAQRVRADDLAGLLALVPVSGPRVAPTGQQLHRPADQPSLRAAAGPSPDSTVPPPALVGRGSTRACGSRRAARGASPQAPRPGPRAPAAGLPAGVRDRSALAGVTAGNGRCPLCRPSVPVPCATVESHGPGEVDAEHGLGVPDSAKPTGRISRTAAYPKSASSTRAGPCRS